MDAVGDEAGGQPVLGELREQGVGELGKQRWQPVAEMRRQAGAGGCGGGDGGVVGGAVADRHQLVLRARPADERVAAGQFGGQRDQQDRSAGGGFQAPQEGDVRRRHAGGWVAAGIAGLGVEERALEMIARDHEGAVPAGGDGRVERCQAGQQRVGRGGDQRRQAACDAVQPHRGQGVVHGGRGQRRVVEIHPGIAVHLQVDEAGVDHGQTLEGGG
jgi:hypothetical protein